MMHIKSSPATPVVGEKRPKPGKREPLQQEPRKVSSFIQRFYLFGNNTSTTFGSEAEPETPKAKKAKAAEQQTVDVKRDTKSAIRSTSSESTGIGTQSQSSDVSDEPSPVQYPSYSVQRLRQFWNNRLLSGSAQQTATGSSIDTLVRKSKSATIGTPTGVAARTVLRKSPSPKAVTRFHRNGSITRSGRRRLTIDNSDSTRIGTEAGFRSTQGPKRTSQAALLSPDREVQRALVEKRQCVGSPTVAAGSTKRDSFPLAIATPTGGQIHWARRTELLGIRALTQEEKKQSCKMPLRVENYVNSYIDVDIQSVGEQDEGKVKEAIAATHEPSNDVVEKLPPISHTVTPVTPVRQTNTSSLGRKGNTPTRKISFLNNISPYNRKLLACNGTKVAALTSKFNQMIQQDAGLLVQVQKRGGYLHKCGNVAYKVIEDPGTEGGYGFTASSRNSGARSSLRKKNSNASATSAGGGTTGGAGTAGGNKTDESSDEISSVSSKNSSIRKTGLRKRPSLRKNIYRRPDWEAGRSSLGVRKVLEMFEPNLHHTRGKRAESGDTGKPPPGRSKPKVPDKSEQVLQKTKDIKSKKVTNGAGDRDNKRIQTDASHVSGDVESAEMIEQCVVDGGEEVTNEKLNVSEAYVPMPGECNSLNDSQKIVFTPKHTTEQDKNKNDSSKIYEYLPIEVSSDSIVPLVDNSEDSTTLRSVNSNVSEELDSSCDRIGFVENSAIDINEKATTINIQPIETVIAINEANEREKSKSAASKIHGRLTFRSSKTSTTEISPALSEKLDENVTLSQEDDSFGEHYATYSSIDKGNKNAGETTTDISTKRSNDMEPVSSPKEIKEKKKSKSTVSKIYERLTFRSSKKIVTPLEKSDELVIIREEDNSRKATGLRRSFVSSIEIPTIHLDEAIAPSSYAPTPEASSGKDTSEQKILDAINAVSQRIDNLSKSFNDLTLTDSELSKEYTPPSAEADIQQVRPNTSFLFRGMGAGGSNADMGSKHASQRKIVEAVNTVVINKSISMDDHHFPYARGEIGRMSLNERSRVQRSLEDDYELVTRPDEKPAQSVETVSCSSPSITIDLTELTSKIESFVHKSKRESDNIYQSIPRKCSTTSKSHLLPEDTISINSYESFENYESIEHDVLTSTRKQNTEVASREEDTYEICSPPPELPPAREDNRNDLTLPQPKRNLSTSPKTLPKHLQVTYQSNYERIKYSKIPPRPPKPEEIPLPPRNNSTTNIAILPNVLVESISSTEDTPSPGGDLLDKSPHGQENIYEENIYDTIRSADGVDYDDPACGGSSAEMEPTQANSPPSRVSPRQQPSPPADSVSLVSSNCYESIGLRLEYDRNLTLTRRNMAGGSTTTLASDQITNSLYGTTAGLASLTPPSERGSDTSNSADWTDISDEDETERTDMAPIAPGSKRPNFIVVRERKRTHQTPLRSRKLARISHPKIDDDSDHHYESLYSIGSNEDRQQHVSNCSTSHGDKPVLSSPAGINFHQHRAAVEPNASILLPNDDEFDSFDSDDTEEDYEDDDEERNRARTDSGVDIRNAKLPDPPPSSSQVYVLVQKIKNLGTLSEIAKSFHKLSKKKPTKGSAGATYENAATVLSPKLPGKGTKSKSFKLPIPLVGGGGGVPKPPPEDYENAPFSGTHPVPPGSSLLLASSQSSSSVSMSNPPYAAVSSPIPEQTLGPPSAGVRSTSESSNVSSYVPGSQQSALADCATRKKSKSTKSLRSKLRKSLVSDSTSLNIGSSFNGSRSTFYVTSADVDSGIFNGSEGCFNPPTSVSQSDMGSSKPLDDHRRKSIASAIGTTSHHRPTIPPPPPPAETGKRTSITSSLSPELSANKSSSKKLGATSWYAECGVFKQPHSFGTGSDQSLSGGKPSSISPRSSIPAKNGDAAVHVERTLPNGGHTTSSWYADIYQTSGASVASSSESSGVSTGGEGGPGDDHSHSMFVNEPLYQIYNAAKLESITRDIDAEISGRTEAELYDDGYEKIAERNRRRNAAEGDEGGSTTSGSSSTDGDDRSDESSMHLRKPSRPTALELIEPHIGKLRTLWCEVPEVRNSEILATLTPTEKRLQEAKFEILTSEASYLKSLNLLRTHFVNHPAFRDTRILSSSERKTLFSSIIPVQECSDRLLCDLENCWQDNIMLLGLSHSIYKHAEKHFHVYVTYCEHQAKIDRTLKALRANKPEFARTLTALEADPVCCSLSLSSFLMLPMQRITRMRLLLDAVLQRCHPEDDDEFSSWESTFVLINRILTQCNDAAHRSEQLYEMELLSRQIEFPTNVRPLAIVPCGIGAATMHRKLEKRGELVHLLWRGDDAKLTFGKKISKSNVYAFLFTDLLVLTKKKSDESYLVIDYCQRALLTVSSGDIVPGLPAKEMHAIGKNLIIMTLLENHEGKTIEMFLSCPSETERERWLMVTEPPASENPDEKIYEQWDCPQVIAVHPYQALQPDELDLDIKDVVNVHRKMADGWYEGERIRDGAVGWFPSNYTKEIPSAHIRAKHIKQRHLLLTYTSKYIDTATKGHQHLHQQQQQQLQHHYQQHGKK
ncbi:uncharacterized protein LOC125767797 [Anopheles funestus]|uniref:uncharacterized protein LOC125767797 n=1 Tax=Anopheles funestus TaxID=62324 RepID=UPI0020C6E5D0|nr:uncharacterized protein LOC125767797 [Anopheles funestus]XP_049290662.1 uncharacterized protein LOC125767797 [Anopheles funestus]XP_049290663.1 uncharacterized protein LOC125767797 [Anopheles funestus]XP_049290664.1 uncharacterized protein LOC125767797 [Anopheles funestus]